MTTTFADPKLDCIGCTKAGKCCDFQPFIPNYLIGAMLSAGLRLPEAGEHYWQPLGLIPARSFRERHDRTADHARREDLWCRWYDPSRRQCSAYAYRPAECRNYFCEGMTSQHHQRSLDEFDIETTTAQGALLGFGYTLEQIHHQVDVLNLEAEPAEANLNQMMALYLAAWAWAGQRDPIKVDPCNERDRAAATNR